MKRLRSLGQFGRQPTRGPLRPSQSLAADPSCGPTEPQRPSSPLSGGVGVRPVSHLQKPGRTRHAGWERALLSELEPRSLARCIALARHRAEPRARRRDPHAAGRLGGKPRAWWRSWLGPVPDSAIGGAALRGSSRRNLRTRRGTISVPILRSGFRAAAKAGTLSRVCGARMMASGNAREPPGEGCLRAYGKDEGFE